MTWHKQDMPAPDRLTLPQISAQFPTPMYTPQWPARNPNRKGIFPPPLYVRYIPAVSGRFGH